MLAALVGLALAGAYMLLAAVAPAAATVAGPAVLVGVLVVWGVVHAQ